MDVLRPKFMFKWIYLIYMKASDLSLHPQAVANTVVTIKHVFKDVTMEYVLNLFFNHSNYVKTLSAFEARYNSFLKTGSYARVSS